MSRDALSPLHVMAKPIGPICNLDCQYCYYLHKEELYPGNRNWRMSSETLEAYIRQVIEAQPPDSPEIQFAWQGGEPTLMGLDFFERVVELQQAYRPPNKRMTNAIQTNGVLLNDAWCEFFRRHGFLVGVSIDGPADLHDCFRRDRQGRPTYEAVVRGLKLLQKHQVEFNALVVVNRNSGDAGRRVYTHLRDLGVRFLQFIPIVERRGVGKHAHEMPPGGGGDPYDRLVSSRSVRPKQFGGFLMDVFREWIRRDVGSVFVQIFDQAVAAWMGVEPGLCVFHKRCGRALVLEHNGDLYSCDHFVEPAYRLGNIHETPVAELAASERQQAFGRNKETSLPRYCLACEVRFACNGECPKNRFLETPDGQPGLNYLCAGYRKFFNDADPFLRMITEELKQGRAAANVMAKLKESGSKASRRVGQEAEPPGRNDLCPCGSGRKFKRCCMRRGQ